MEVVNLNLIIIIFQSHIGLIRYFVFNYGHWIQMHHPWYNRGFWDGGEGKNSSALIDENFKSNFKSKNFEVFKFNVFNRVLFSLSLYCFIVQIFGKCKFLFLYEIKLSYLRIGIQFVFQLFSRFLLVRGLTFVKNQLQTHPFTSSSLPLLP